jgi:hypothetical protein
VYGNPEAAIDLIVELAAAVPLLQARVGELERKIALLSRDSSNSSKPPSSESPEGELLTARLLTVTGTCLLQGKSPFQYLIEALNAYRSGLAPPSLVSASR